MNCRTVMSTMLITKTKLLKIHLLPSIICHIVQPLLRVQQDINHVGSQAELW